jgi:hypothetical protein
MVSARIALQLTESEWFKMKDTFPREQMLVRNDRSEALRVIYLTNAVLKVGA